MSAWIGCPVWQWNNGGFVPCGEPTYGPPPVQQTPCPAALEVAALTAVVAELRARLDTLAEEVAGKQREAEWRPYFCPVCSGKGRAYNELLHPATCYACEGRGMLYRPPKGT